MKFKSFFGCVIVSMLFSGCNPGDNNNSSNSVSDEAFAENFGSAASRDFIGQVVDADNHPIQDATVKIGSSAVQTDVNGVFIINNADVHERFTYITAKKAGFIDGSRSMVPVTGKNNVKIMLIPSTPAATIASGAPGEVTLASGTKVVFDGAFQDADGNDYSGDVRVAMFHLVPSDENISSLMPGMLFAKGDDGNAKMLQTFGMLNVELRGSAGQKLNIKTGHTAQISMKIDGAQLATAPESIPLWHFDDAVGYWKQDGAAVKQGNFYVGNVSHFSWWNCDTFSSTITLHVTVKDNSGETVANAGVGLVVVSNNFASYVSLTNADGQVSGLVPMNEPISLTIFDICGNPMQTVTVGPFSADTVLAPITIALTQTQVSHVLGRLNKCDGTPVTNGYALLHYGNATTIHTVTEGIFGFTSMVCSSSSNFEIEGYDVGNSQTTGRIAYSFNFPETNIGHIQACNAVTEFGFYQINNEPVVYFNAPFDVTTNPTQLAIHYALNYYAFSFSGINATYLPGTYGTDNFQGQGTGFYILNPAPVIFKVNKFGAIGDYIDISFQGEYSPGQNITGVMHVIRDN